VTKKRAPEQHTEMIYGAPVAKLRRYTLRSASPGVEPTVAMVGASSLSVGQSEANDVRVGDTSVSRFHFELAREKEALIIRDLGSTNGTLVEGVFVREARLSPGQRIRAGRVEFTLEAEGEPSQVDALQSDTYGELVAGSESMRVLFALMDKAAQSSVTVLIQGESGTGKELVAEEIHRHSQRRDGPFIIVDCGALPDDLIESELFGHEKGAFTGAATERAGAFESAHGGTLFLDEIGELPLALQPKLLRALEARTIKRLGSNQRRDVDIRFVAASNRNLREEVNRHTFREDLFWRLSVLEMRIPPLRERSEDIPALVQALWQRTEVTDGPPTIDAETMAQLATLPWRGNVRELRNFVERTAVLGAVQLPSGTLEYPPLGRAATVAVRTDLSYKEAKELWTNHFERTYLEDRLVQAEGNMSRLSREASIDRAYLLKLLKKHKLR